MQEIQFPGETNINVMQLMSHSGRVIDINGLAVEVNIFEDIYATTMSGYVIIRDAVGLLDALPLIGQERLQIEYQTPSLDKKISGAFYVYKLTVIERNARMVTYMLNFCSPELINSMNNRVARSFKGTISDTVESIFYDDRYMNTAARLDMIVTKNSLQFVAPFWTPIETINWLTTKSVAHDDTSDFVFYQDNQRFNFKPISSLFDAVPEREYIAGDLDSNTQFGAAGDIASKYKIVEMVSDSTTFDYMRALAAGAYASQLQMFDITTRSIKSDSFDYIRDFDQQPHLNGYPIRSKDLVKNSRANISHVLQNNYRTGRHERQSFMDGFLSRAAYIDSLNTIKLSVKTYGRTDMKVGDVVKFQTVDNRQIAGDEILAKAKSDYYSGKYLVTAIRHQFVANQHTMFMEIVSDSFATKI